MTQVELFVDVEFLLRERISFLMRFAPLSRCELKVIEALLHYYAFGRERAVSISKMQLLWAGGTVYSDRSVKDAVKGLLETHNLPIGSCRVPGKHGYYLIQDDTDAEEASRPLRNEIHSMFRRLKVISPKSSFVRGLQGQMDLLKEER